MALADAYATYDQYKAAIGGQGDARQDLIERALLVASRLIESPPWTGRIFNQTAAGVVRYFDGNDDAELWIDDLVSVSAIGVDVDQDGTYSQAIGTGHVIKRPRNAAEIGHPFTSLELRAGLGAALALWPAGLDVKITGAWGWPSVPAPITSAAIILARQILDLEDAGLTMTLQAVDEQVQVRPGVGLLLHNLHQAYRRHMPGVAGF